MHIKKALIILFSHHHKNTEKIAQVIAGAIGAEIKTPKETDPNAVLGYDLVGFGSGVYFGKLHKELLEFADELPQVQGNKAFIFSTSGEEGKGSKFHKPLREKLLVKGFIVAGEFNCQGLDTFGFNKLRGGVGKGRPNQDDLKQAEVFAQNLILAK